MRVISIGGGPAGLYTGILLKKAHPDWEYTVYERNAPDDTFGFGVVFSAATLGELGDADAESYDAIMAASARWDPVDVFYGNERVRGRGNGFAAISRKTLLRILQERAAELGADLHFRSDVGEPAALIEEADLLLAADGLNSATRRAFADDFEPRLTTEGSKFIWMGTTKTFDSFTFFFRENEHGRFQVHAYPYEEELSTFIVECDRDSWRAAGLDRYEDNPLPPGESDLESLEYCQQLFAADLDGHKLLPNNSKWLDWVTVRNRTWRSGNVVLLGDAAHTAHFSIGSGTKLAMEDAIAFASALERHDGLDTALANYEADRKLAVERVQAAAAESLDWFARYHRYCHFEPPQFAYSLLTRSKRVTYENLRRRDPRFLAGFERWFAERAGLSPDGTRQLVTPAPAFTPLRVRGTELPNRILLTAAQDRAAKDGNPSSAALGEASQLSRSGASLMLAEDVAISAGGRITSGSWGLYDDRHTEAWGRLVDDARRDGRTAVGLQLVHAGRRGATRIRDRGTDRPLRTGAWPLVAASPLPYTPQSQVPAELDREGMTAVREDFCAAARRADEAGIDVLEIHAGSGYLLASFLSPLTNQRDDDYGGDLDARVAFPLEVIEAVRAIWPAEKALSVCLTVSDLQRGGTDEDMAVETARRFLSAGVDLFNCVAGQTTTAAWPDYQRAYFAPYSDVIRNRADAPTIASGDISDPAQVNGLIAAGQADLCILGRPMVREPEWRQHDDR